MSMNYEKIEIVFVSFPTNYNRIIKQEFSGFVPTAGAILRTKISDYTLVNNKL